MQRNEHTSASPHQTVCHSACHFCEHHRAFMNVTADKNSDAIPVRRFCQGSISVRHDRRPRRTQLATSARRGIQSAHFGARKNTQRMITTQQSPAALQQRQPESNTARRPSANRRHRLLSVAKLGSLISAGALAAAAILSPAPSTQISHVTLTPAAAGCWDDLRVQGGLMISVSCWMRSR